jgi:hypothetical protein
MIRYGARAMLAAKAMRVLQWSAWTRGMLGSLQCRHGVRCWVGMLPMKRVVEGIALSPHHGFCHLTSHHGFRHGKISLRILPFHYGFRHGKIAPWILSWKDLTTGKVVADLACIMGGTAILPCILLIPSYHAFFVHYGRHCHLTMHSSHSTIDSPATPHCRQS